jgi:hypothetical protein
MTRTYVEPARVFRFVRFLHHNQRIDRNLVCEHALLFLEYEHATTLRYESPFSCGTFRISCEPGHAKTGDQRPSRNQRMYWTCV